MSIFGAKKKKVKAIAESSENAILPDNNDSQVVAASP
jgi:hypothetical protein